MVKCTKECRHQWITTMLSTLKKQNLHLDNPANRIWRRCQIPWWPIKCKTILIHSPCRLQVSKRTKFLRQQHSRRLVDKATSDCKIQPKPLLQPFRRHLILQVRQRQLYHKTCWTLLAQWWARQRINLRQRMLRTSTRVTTVSQPIISSLQIWI